jgi:small subunit ribosomal protein S17
MAEPRATPAARPAGGRRQQRVGRVVSVRMNKTIVVEVTRHAKHPLYQRVVRRRKKFYVHDEQNQCREGDLVRIEQSRPLSRLKRWRLVEVLGRAGA